MKMIKGYFTVILLLAFTSYSVLGGIEPKQEIPLNQAFCHIDGTTEYFIFKENEEVAHGDHFSGMPSPYSYLKVDWSSQTSFQIHRYKSSDHSFEDTLGSFSLSDDKNLLIRGPWQARDYFSPEFCD